jgi:hypothetical protein
MVIKCFMDDNGKFYRAEGKTVETCLPQSASHIEKPCVSVEGLEALTFTPVSQIEWDVRIQGILAKAKK